MKIDTSARTHTGRIATVLASAALVVLAGCQAAASPTAPSASVAVAVTPPPSESASPSAAAAATTRPTPEPLPTVFTRPTDIPTDGAARRAAHASG